MILGFKPLNSVVATKMQTQPHVFALFSIRSMAMSTNWFPQSYRYEPKTSIKTFELMEHNPSTGCKTEDKGLKRNTIHITHSRLALKSFTCVSVFPRTQVCKFRKQNLELGLLSFFFFCLFAASVIVLFLLSEWHFFIFLYLNGSPLVRWEGLFDFWLIIIFDMRIFECWRGGSIENLKNWTLTKKKKRTVEQNRIESESRRRIYSG